VANDEPAVTAKHGSDDSAKNSSVGKPVQITNAPADANPPADKESHGGNAVRQDVVADVQSPPTPVPAADSAKTKAAVAPDAVTPIANTPAGASNGTSDGQDSNAGSSNKKADSPNTPPPPSSQSAGPNSPKSSPAAVRASDSANAKAAAGSSNSDTSKTKTDATSGGDSKSQDIAVSAPPHAKLDRVIFRRNAAQPAC